MKLYISSSAANDTVTIWADGYAERTYHGTSYGEAISDYIAANGLTRVFGIRHVYVDWV